MSDFSFTIPRGDTRTIHLELHRPKDGPAIALNGTEKVWFTAKYAEDDTDAEAFIQKGVNVAGLTGIAIVDAENGLCDLYIEPDDTITLDERTRLFCDVQLAEGDTITTVARGTLTVRPDITRATV